MKTNLSLATKLLLGLSISIGIFGCSQLELSMKWADTYVLSQLSDYFDMTSKQKTEARQEFKKALQDVKKNEFKVLAKKLTDFAADVESQKLKPESVEALIGSLEPLFQKGLMRFETMAQKMVTDQSATSFSRFDDFFLSKYNSDLKDVTDPKQIKKDSQKRIDFWLKETVEKLTPEQEKWLDDETKKNPYPKLLQLESRRTVFEQFKKLRNDPEKRKTFIHQLMTDWESLQTPEFQKARLLNQKNSVAWMLHILKTMTAQQQQNLLKNLKKRASEFQRLSEEALLTKPKDSP